MEANDNFALRVDQAVFTYVCDSAHEEHEMCSTKCDRPLPPSPMAMDSRKLSVDASAVVMASMRASPTLLITPADSIEDDDSPSLPESLGVSPTVSPAHHRYSVQQRKGKHDLTPGLAHRNYPNEKSLSTDNRESSESDSSPKRKEPGAWEKIFGKPIQRSRSAGSRHDVPAHALFLHHDHRKQNMKTFTRSDADATEDDPTSEIYDGDKAKREKEKKRPILDVRDVLSFFNRKLSSDSGSVLSCSGSSYTLLGNSRSFGGSTGRLSASSSSPKLWQRKADPGRCDSSQPSAEQLRRWSRSFDNLLNDPCGLSMFHSFLKTEYSEENIQFWMACEAYRSLSGVKKMNREAQRIYREYLSVQAPQEVNLDSKTRLQTIAALSTPNKLTFDQAQRKIQALMEKDSYQRFLRSDPFHNLVKTVDSTVPEGDVEKT